MASTIKIKRSAVPSTPPLTTNLELGELAINTYDGKLYLKKSVSGTESIVEVGAGLGGGVTSVNSLTGAITATNLLDAIKTVDGGNSGLDAALLGGNPATAFYFATNPAGYTSNTGTVTSVASLTLGTTGTDVSSTVANNTTAPAITLNIPTASATNRGALSAADWTTFNNKTSNTGTVTSVGGTGTVSGLTLTGTVTTTGNLTLGGTLAVTASNFASQTANTVLAAPNGSAGTPTFRVLAVADIPTLNQNTTGSANRIGFSDRRSTVQTPSYFGAGVDWSFMANSTDGLSDGGTYHGVMHYQPYSDATGGGAYELGFTDNNNLWLRGSSGALTSFAAWKKVWDTGNLTNLNQLTNGPGYTTNTGTVTSVEGTGSYGGLTLTGTVTTSGNLTLGGTPTGTWPISISGTPTFAGDAADKADMTTRADSGFYQSSTGTLAEGWPTNSEGWHHLIACTHTNDNNYYSLQLSSTFFDQELYFRATNGSGTTAWSKLLHSGNYNTYSPTLTGTGASGNWGINVTGTAASITGTYEGTITSSQITTGLGFTPYNATNPSGYTANTGTVTSITAGTGLSGGAITGSGTIAIDSTVATLTGTQTLTNKTLTTPTITGLATFTGVYHNTYLTTYGSLFIEGSSTNNIVQVSSTGVTTGVGLWSNGVSGILYANAGLYFKVGTTLRDQDTPTGGTIALTIGSDTNATFAGTVTATSFVGSGSSLTGVQPTLVSGTNIKTINGVTILGSGNIDTTGGSELQNRYQYTATSSQTTFSATYTAPYVDVYYNGVKLINLVDFTATNGTTVVLTTPAIVGDLIEIIGHKIYDVAAIATTNLTDWPVGLSTTELSYLDGVTSSVQTQLSTKASTGKAIAMAMIFGG